MRTRTHFKTHFVYLVSGVQSTCVRPHVVVLVVVKEDLARAGRPVGAGHGQHLVKLMGDLILHNVQIVRDVVFVVGGGGTPSEPGVAGKLVVEVLLPPAEQIKVLLGQKSFKFELLEIAVDPLVEALGAAHQRQR